MIDTLLLCLASGGRSGKISSCNLFPHLKKHLLAPWPPSRYTMAHIYRSYTKHKASSFLIKVSSQSQQIEMYPPHTSHCLYGVMLFIILTGPKCLFSFLQGMKNKCMFIRVFPTLRWAPLYSENVTNVIRRTQIGWLWFFSSHLYQDVSFFCLAWFLHAF